ncbi:MAG: hypothetical protein K1X75_00560 [Leptospirales bacterium]|nr:hypothetical protein [Leptospirales bacterium]
MSRIAKLATAVAIAFPAALFAEDELPPASVDVSLQFVSNYVWRGYDLYQNYASQQGRAYGSASGALAFQPSITVNTPVEGLYANAWMSIAMQGRQDTDTDQLLQIGPGLSGNDANGNLQGANLVTLSREAGGAYGLPELQATYDSLLTTAGLNATGATLLEQTANGGRAPGFHKEQNGLRRLDEIDLTLGYQRETNAGTLGFGLVAYLKPNPVNTTPTPSSELFLTYSFPDALSFLSTGIYGDIQANTLYVPVTIEFAPEPFFFSLSAGYGVAPGVNNWQDLTGGIGFALSGFNVGLYVVYRPTLAFFDTDTAGRDVPAWMVGGSTKYDGLVADPSKTNGAVNSDLNNLYKSFLTPQIGSVYNYTPRQKLPRVLYYLNVGYSFSV